MRQFNFKIVVIGDKGVGKTSLINKYILNKFERDYISTIGVNILLKDMQLEKDQITYICQLMFWDVGGQEKFGNVRHMFYRGANAALLVYDLTRPASFLMMPDFLQDLEDTLQKKIPFVILGNKVDLGEMRHVERENAEKLMETSQALAFFETSAKTGANVEESFKRIAEVCLRNALSYKS
ncbi:MAG: GTP-binding protein [Candidatus Helarchaeota archaeon]|nr:GTP-binding protein [Candidatus Helarchaeota archaeon]